MTENQDPYFSNYAEMIVYLRKEKGITALELAEKMGVSPVYIAKIETGEIEPNKEQIETLRSFIDGRL